MTRRKDETRVPGWGRLLSVDLAAAYLSVSPNTLAALQLPCVQVRGRKLFDRVDLDAFVDGLKKGGSNDNVGRSALEMFLGDDE